MKRNVHGKREEFWNVVLISPKWPHTILHIFKSALSALHAEIFAQL